MSATRRRFRRRAKRLDDDVDRFVPERAVKRRALGLQVSGG